MTHHPAWQTFDGDATATDGPAWRTSSYSGNGENCVEIAPGDAGVMLRDTKDHGAGPVIAFTRDEWSVFLRETATHAPSENGAVTVVHSTIGTAVHTVMTGVRLGFTPSEWAAFRSGVRDGEFDTVSAV